jgi:hypothetical protein
MDLTCSEYVQDLTDFQLSLERYPAMDKKLIVRVCSERNLKTQPHCESDVQIASERNFGTQIQNATKKPLASCSRVMQI